MLTSSNHKDTAWFMSTDYVLLCYIAGLYCSYLNSSFPQQLFKDFQIYNCVGLAWFLLDMHHQILYRQVNAIAYVQLIKGRATFQYILAYYCNCKEKATCTWSFTPAD